MSKFKTSQKWKKKLLNIIKKKYYYRLQKLGTHLASRKENMSKFNTRQKWKK